MLLEGPTQSTKAEPILEHIRSRRSPKGFRNTNVVDEKIRNLFEAARWSPSSRNEQPWRFIVASKRRPEQFAAMLSTLTLKNQLWAQEADVLVAVVTKMDFDHDGKMNRHAFYDAGGAVATLTLQAVSAGLQVHQMAGFDGAKIRDRYAIPSTFEPVVVLAIGYEDERGRNERTRTRKDLDEVVFGDSWLNSSTLVIGSEEENE